MRNAKADASLYILTGLFQRLEGTHPGLLRDMINGVKADQSSIPDDSPEKAYIEEIFKESLTLLERASLLLANSSDS